jgi:hypothetical protein
MGSLFREVTMISFREDKASGIFEISVSGTVTDHDVQELAAALKHQTDCNHQSTPQVDFSVSSYQTPRWFSCRPDRANTASAAPPRTS